jgi:hypothetical protein
MGGGGGLSIFQKHPYFSEYFQNDKKKQFSQFKKKKNHFSHSFERDG